MLSPTFDSTLQPAAVVGVFLVAGATVVFVGSLVRAIAGRADARTPGRRWWPVGTAVSAVAFALLVPWILDPLAEGTWTCVVCARTREEVRCLDVRVLVGEPQMPDVQAERAARFERWSRGVLGSEHAHDWMPVGCHAIGLRTVRCHGFPGESWFACLPLLPADGAAEEALRLLVDAAPARRRRVLRAFDATLRRSATTAPGSGDSAARALVALEHVLAADPAWR